MDADMVGAADGETSLSKELGQMKKRLKEMEDVAGALSEMLAKIEKKMGPGQGRSFLVQFVSCNGQDAAGY
ncbi:Polyadenylate-binding protein 2 [Nymphaea thermarum]|nr:Polyadenylate-binding protein 2 [Nymphaea thermarum]